MSDDLDRLRQKLDRLDGELLAAVAERQRIVAEIGRLKRAQELYLRDFGRERQVLEQAFQRGAELDLDSTFVGAMFGLLIEHSLQFQERHGLAAGAGGDGLTALVLGGRGRMGRWFADFLAIQGYRIAIADPAEAPSPYPAVDDWRSAAKNANLVVVAAPLQVSAGLLTELLAIEPQGLVFDLGSLKSPLRPALEALCAAGVQVTSLHPLFGPAVRMLSGRHVAIVDVGCATANERAAALFAGTMAEIVSLSIAEHDRLMAYVLSFSHLLNIAFTAVLASSGEQALQLRRVSSTTFEEQLKVARRISGENPEVYFEIQTLNPYAAAVRRALSEALAALDRALTAKSRQAFYDVFAGNVDYLTNARLPPQPGG